MARERKEISEFDRRFIIGRSGGRCNKCRQEVFVENEFGEKARLGDDAHIVAFSQIGPRGNSPKTDTERASAQNLLLLCKTCHSEIDQQPQKYDEAKIIQIRDNHYAWVEASLGERIAQRPRFHYLSYINIPRADMYAVVNSISLPNIRFENAKSIRDLGMQAGRLMAAYTGILNHEDLYANEFGNETKLNDLNVGSYWFSPPSNFRSKRLYDQTNLVAAWGKLESVIYRKFEGWKLYCLIDPRWITTSTAYITLGGGTLTSMGLVHINSVDIDKKIAIASPLFLGAPDNGFFS